MSERPLGGKGVLLAVTLWTAVVVLLAACATATPPAATAGATPGPPPSPEPTGTSVLSPTGTPSVPNSLQSSGGLIGAWVNAGTAQDTCAAWQRNAVAATLLWVRWGDVDKGDGTYDWTALDGLVDGLRACGLEPALHIQARQSQYRPSALPENLDAYRHFLTNLVTHLKGRVRRYSIENEAVAGTLMWADSPENYFLLLDEAYTAIKAADPEAIVLESGLSNAALGTLVAYSIYQSGRPQAALDLYRAVLADSGPRAPARLPKTVADLRAAFKLPLAQRAMAWMPLMKAHQASYDAVQIHYYGSWQNLPKVMQWLKGQGIDKPIEAWELAKHARDSATFDETVHAQESARLLVTAAGEGSRFSIFIRYLDWSATQLPGLVTSQGPRPAETAFRVVAQRLNGFQAVERLDLGPSVWGYRFTGPEGELYALWTSSGQTTVGLALPGPKVIVTDIQAQSIQADSANLSVGPSPILVTP